MHPGKQEPTLPHDGGEEEESSRLLVQRKERVNIKQIKDAKVVLRL